MSINNKYRIEYTYTETFWETVTVEAADEQEAREKLERKVSQDANLVIVTVDDLGEANDC